MKQVGLARQGLGGWIDSHAHLWDLPRRKQGWMDPEWELPARFVLADLEATLADAGFGSAILVQSTEVLAETREFLALANHSDAVAGVVGWLDLTGDIAAQLDAIGPGEDRTWLVGVRHPAEHDPDPAWLSRPEVMAGVADLGGFGLAYDVLVRPRHFESVKALARHAPATRLVLDHCGKPPVGGQLRQWAAGLRELARFDQMACKVSGLVTEVEGRGWTIEDLRPVVETALEVFGPKRVMFGSDWPLCLLAAEHQEVVNATVELTAPLSEPERQLVFRDTARRWYGLRDGESGVSL